MDRAPVQWTAGNFLPAYQPNLEAPRFRVDAESRHGLRLINMPEFPFFLQAALDYKKNGFSNFPDCRNDSAFMEQ